MPFRLPTTTSVYGRRWSRGFRHCARQNVQRLLWAGSVLDQTSSTLSEVPKDWFLAMGMQADVEQGLSFRALAASHSHALIAYITLPPSLPVSHSTFGAEDNEHRPINPSGLHKIAAIGRNTYGELGLGFSSQESTWGMVSAGFEGAGGVEALRCGLGSSWVVTRERDAARSASRLYSFGNHTSGQLGLGGEPRPYALSNGGEPQLQLFSSPRRVPLVEDSATTVEAISSGLDHTVVLLRHADGQQKVYTCGINTDGQLGLPSIRVSSPSLRLLCMETFQPSLPLSEDDPIVGVAAGGDTSAIWTASGRIWAWGNSEYGQALVGGKAIDRIDVPTEATDDVAQAIESKVVDIRLGGSFVVLLDVHGNVYTAGYGALGQGKDNLLSHMPRKIISGATGISAGLEQASAVLHGEQDKVGKRRIGLAVWGLDSTAGRLGLGTRKPYPSYMVASRFTPRDVELRIYQPALVKGLQREWTGAGDTRDGGILDVVHAREATFVLVEDGVDDVGRWQPKETL